MTVHTTNQVILHFNIPVINMDITFPMERQSLERLQQTAARASENSPIKFRTNVEIVKTIAVAIFTLAASLITMPIWIPGLLIGTAVMGPGVWIATPFMGICLWQLAERIVEAFHRQHPVFLEYLTAEFVMEQRDVSHVTHEDRIRIGHAEHAEPRNMFVLGRS